jgi:hypothetical protein
MTDVEIRRPVPLRTVPGVELAAVGTWKASTGTTTFTAEDFAHAVAALDCPGVRSPVLKLGHAEDDSTSGIRWDGEPAVGWVANMRLGNDGKLRGDFTGMPAWLADADDNGLSALASAYPDRSIEIYRPFLCQVGHTHPAVITAVALLGVTAPGVGVLKSMQDVYAAFTQSPDARAAASAMRTTVRTSIGDTMPAAVQASVSVEEISRRYYESAGYSTWITAMHVDPLELVVADDATGKFHRVSVQMGKGGEFTFGEPQEVAIVYSDVKSAASALPYRWQDRRAALSAQGVAEDEAGEETPALPDTAPIAPDVSPAGAAIRKMAATQAPDAAPAAGSTTTGKEESGMAFDPTKLREALGLAADASDEDVRTALSGALPEKPPAGSAPSDPDPAQLLSAIPKDGNAILLDRENYATLVELARRGDQAYEAMKRGERDSFLKAACKAGRFPVSRLQAYKDMWDEKPEETRRYVEMMPPNSIPVTAAGSYGADVDLNEADLAYAAMYPGTER